MTRKKTTVRQKVATGSVLQRAAKAIGSAVGTLVATTGVTDAKDLLKNGPSEASNPVGVETPTTKRVRKVATRKTPAMKPGGSQDQTFTGGMSPS